MAERRLRTRTHCATAPFRHASGHAPEDPRAQERFAPFGTVMKDASGFQTQGVLYSIPQGPHRHPPGPPVLAESNITPLVSRSLSGLSHRLLCWPSRPASSHPVRQARPHPSRQFIRHSLRHEKYEPADKIVWRRRRRTPHSAPESLIRRAGRKRNITPLRFVTADAPLEIGHTGHLLLGRIRAKKKEALNLSNLRCPICLNKIPNKPTPTV